MRQLIGLLISTIFFQHYAYSAARSFDVAAGPYSLSAPSIGGTTSPELKDAATVEVNGRAAVIGVQRSKAPFSLKLLRRQLREMERKSSAQAAKDGVFVSTSKRFPAETFTFFLAGGFITFNSMWLKSGGDPLALEKQIMSLKDPIAHLSFYTFMQSQGFYMNFHTKRAGLASMDAITRKQFMRRLQYTGMAIGSFASTVVSDLGYSMQQCANKWISGKTDDASLASCDQALAQWTVRGKFTQYVPQIFSLFAGQALSDFIDGTAQKSFSKLSSSSGGRIAAKYLYRVAAVDIVTTFVGGGWVAKSIKAVGKFSKISVFIAADHFISSSAYRAVNNIMLPVMFDYDVAKLNLAWQLADNGNWDDSKISDKNLASNFESNLDTFAKSMQGWRSHLNQDAEMAVNGWSEMTKKLLYQNEYAYQYYKGFSNLLFETLQYGYDIQHRGLKPVSVPISRFPTRLLPFYGVKTTLPPTGKPIRDLYLGDPNQLEANQKAYVLTVGQAWKKDLSGRLSKLAFSASEKTLIMDILTKMSSNKDYDMGLGISTLNIILKSGSKYSSKFVNYVKALRTSLGDPYPILKAFAGYSQAFTADSAHALSAEEAGYSKISLANYDFARAPDLMFYNLLCGNQKSSITSRKLMDIQITHPEFQPPTMMKSSSLLSSYCSRFKNSKKIYTEKIGGKELESFLLSNINYSIVGDYRKQNDNGANSFESWWINSAKAPLKGVFKKYDQDFRIAFEASRRNFNGQRSFGKRTLDVLNQSAYLRKDLKSNMDFELEVYLQLLNRAVSGSVQAPNISNQKEYTLSSNLSSALKSVAGSTTVYNYVGYASSNVNKGKFQSVYNNSAYRQINEIRTVFDAYYYLVNSTGFNYWKHAVPQSKKLDTALNDILVAAGLKKLVSNSNLLASYGAGGAASENSERTYESVNVANPTFKQRMAQAAVDRIRELANETKQLLRMKAQLSESLDVDFEDVKADWLNNPPIKSNNGPVGVGPYK